MNILFKTYFQLFMDVFEFFVCGKDFKIRMYLKINYLFGWIKWGFKFFVNLDGNLKEKHKSAKQSS